MDPKLHFPKEETEVGLRRGRETPPPPRTQQALREGQLKEGMKPAAEAGGRPSYIPASMQWSLVGGGCMLQTLKGAP